MVNGCRSREIGIRRNYSFLLPIITPRTIASCPNESEGFVAISWPKGANRPVLWREVYYPYNMAGEPIIKRQESEENHEGFQKIIHEKTLPSTDSSNEYDPEKDFLDEDSSTKKTEEDQNDEEQNGEPEN
ncbi:hypothetical protein B5X24_HaOG208665 [Helicoverpa armigera]|uniref:Uncharacterized protein n=1 Tax=Helicoverpa armigera TaxID=29058 RepID=A0A2W1BKT6_HELAM|nr:hypothetical protein B5X24_HaOG208665 [Helicoverpa armigera]